MKTCRRTGCFPCRRAWAWCSDGLIVDEVRLNALEDRKDASGLAQAEQMASIARLRAQVNLGWTAGIVIALGFVTGQ